MITVQPSGVGDHGATIRGGDHGATIRGGDHGTTIRGR